MGCWQLTTGFRGTFPISLVPYFPEIDFGPTDAAPRARAGLKRRIDRGFLISWR